jgi:signal transduction histidine kinase
MSRFNSLAFRLFATAAIWFLVFLPTAGIVIIQMYRKQAETSFDGRVVRTLLSILNDTIETGGNEPGQPKNVVEPLYMDAESGWYWQIKPLDVSPTRPGRILGSASLGSENLTILLDKTTAREKHTVWGYTVDPRGLKLRQAETMLLVGEGDEVQRYAIMVTGKIAEVEVDVRNFVRRLIAAFAAAGAGLLVVTLLQIRFILYPLRRVEKGLNDIRTGKSIRLAGIVPSEITSLQEEMNALLKSNEDVIERARTQVGNLAHGLKTPIAVLVNEARDHNSPLSAKVVEQTTLMRDQVQHYLDRARMAARVGVIGRVTEIEPVATSIARALERIHRDKDLLFDIICDPSVKFQGEKQDLEEMLGNLLDNASKWTKTEVRLTATVEDVKGTKLVAITVEDDGPGLTDEQLAEPIQRGRRLDETKPGSGLGQSIVADLAHSYHGTFTLARSPLGGLAATLRLPSA